MGEKMGGCIEWYDDTTSQIYNNWIRVKNNEGGCWSYLGQAVTSGVLLHLLLAHLCPLILPTSINEAAAVLPTLSFSTSVSILLRFWPGFYSNLWQKLHYY